MQTGGLPPRAGGEEVVMRNLLLKGLGAASVIGVLAAVTVPAHAADVRAQIPFSFSVNQKSLPPGTYTVTSTGATALMVRGASSGAVSLSHAIENASQQGAKLVFHRYGDQYVLREVWSGSQGRKLPEPKLERELIARNGVASMQIVEVAIPTL
jgi:hypothetical protein